MYTSSVFYYKGLYKVPPPSAQSDVLPVVAHRPLAFILPVLIASAALALPLPVVAAPFAQPLLPLAYPAAQILVHKAVASPIPAPTAVGLFQPPQPLAVFSSPIPYRISYPPYAPINAPLVAVGTPLFWSPPPSTIVARAYAPVPGPTAGPLPSSSSFLTFTLSPVRWISTTVPPISLAVVPPVQTPQPLGTLPQKILPWVVPTLPTTPPTSLTLSVQQSFLRFASASLIQARTTAPPVSLTVVPPIQTPQLLGLLPSKLLSWVIPTLPITPSTALMVSVQQSFLQFVSASLIQVRTTVPPVSLAVVPLVPSAQPLFITPPPLLSWTARATPITPPTASPLVQGLVPIVVPPAHLLSRVTVIPPPSVVAIPPYGPSQPLFIILEVVRPSFRSVVPPTEDRGPTLTRRITTGLIYQVPRLIVSAITSPFESLIWTSYGVPYVHTAANWANVTFHAEAYMRAAVGTTHYRYYNLTDAVAVAGSDLSTASATMVLQRTGALTLVTGKTYEHQFARSVAGAGEKQYAMLLGIPI